MINFVIKKTFHQCGNINITTTFMLNGWDLVTLTKTQKIFRNLMTLFSIYLIMDESRKMFLNRKTMVYEV